ncbi:MAG TPA: OmpA family protein [Rhizomicrobium sp.]|nr:OmpA family protein [Rhizomicrobium sp.]
MSNVTITRTRSFLARLMPAAALSVALALGACAGNGLFDDLDQATPTGSAFSQALFKNYAYLARSYGAQTSMTSGTAFDSEGSMSLGDVSDNVADIANLFAQKALRAARGENVLPEPAPPSLDNASALRTRLLQALDQGRDKAPDAAARAQADFDCWVLNSTVPALGNSAAACQRSLNTSLTTLEHAVNPPPPPQAAAADYTVYFDFDSWTLTAEGLSVLTQAIDTARSGGQSTINIVGHTDTAGSASYNQALSLKRANVVKEVLVQMGARPEAIQVSGVGENDLAVQTGDGVREPKNRRAVVTLAP